MFLIFFQVFHLIFHIPSKQSGSRKCHTGSVMTFATQRQWIHTLLSVAGAAVEDRIDGKNLDIGQFCFLYSLLTGTTSSYRQGFVIPNQISSKRGPETVRTGQSQDGAGTELSAAGTVAPQGWHTPSHLPQVIPGGCTHLCHGNSPQLLCRSAGWAGRQSRRQREEGQITAEGSCSILTKCKDNFNLPCLLWSLGANNFSGVLV